MTHSSSDIILKMGWCPVKYVIAVLACHVVIGKTPQIPCVSVSCNPRTVEPTHTFHEQLIVVKNQFLAARNKNRISRATRNLLYLVESSTKQYWLFLSRHKIGQFEGRKYIIPEQHKIIDFLQG
jgi:hypothetical protein